MQQSYGNILTRWLTVRSYRY